MKYKFSVHIVHVLVYVYANCVNLSMGVVPADLVDPTPSVPATSAVAMDAGSLLVDVLGVAAPPQAQPQAQPQAFPSSLVGGLSPGADEGFNR